MKQLLAVLVAAMFGAMSVAAVAQDKGGSMDKKGSSMEKKDAKKKDAKKKDGKKKGGDKKGSSMEKKS